MARIASSLKRSLNNWVPGKWYRNPMMQRHGVSQVLYTRVLTSNFIYENSHAIIFDLGITEDGDVHENITQSNALFEKEMTEATPEELEWIAGRLRAYEKRQLYRKYGL